MNVELRLVVVIYRHFVPITSQPHWIIKISSHKNDLNNIELHQIGEKFALYNMGAIIVQHGSVLHVGKARKKWWLQLMF